MNYQYPFLNSFQSNLLRVNGIEGARAYSMAPNTTTALFDANEDVFYVKSADAGGFSTIQAYSFKRMEEAPTVAAEYVTRREFEELKEALNGKLTVPKSKSESERNSAVSAV